MDDKDTVERAKEIFVYGPIGLAMYVRDAAPSFLKVFVARGRAEVEQRRKSVGDQIGQVRDAGEAATDTAPQMLRLVSDGLTRVRETAEGALAVLGTFGGEDGDLRSPSRPERAAPDSPAGRDTPSESAADPGLAISEYEGLSASQVVDRLEGLAPADLEAIRVYEVGHRARATILGKIEQLTRSA